MTTPSPEIALKSMLMYLIKWLSLVSSDETKELTILFAWFYLVVVIFLLCVNSNIGFWVFKKLITSLHADTPSVV